MMTFDEAAEKVFGKRHRDAGDYDQAELDALLILQHGFMDDIENSWVGAIMPMIANRLAAEIVESESDIQLSELVPTIFRNALSIGVAIGVLMERADVKTEGAA